MVLNVCVCVCVCVCVLPPGDVRNVWRHFWLSQLGPGVLFATGIWQVGARDAAKHPAIHRTSPNTKYCLLPNVSEAEVEKSSFRFR